MIGKFIGQQVPAVGFSIGFERICGILAEQGFAIPAQKPKMALLYLPGPTRTSLRCWPRRPPCGRVTP